MTNVLLLGTFILAIGCVALLAYYLFKVIRTSLRKSGLQSQTEQLRKNMELLDQVIESNVVYVNQKMVNPLKAQGCFLQQEKEEAFCECRNRIYRVISPDVVKSLEDSVSDLDEFICPRIEYHVRKQKQ